MDDINETAYEVLKETLSVMKASKPDERSERARSYAVTITELEKVIAYFKVFVVDAKEECQP